MELKIRLANLNSANDVLEWEYMLSGNCPLVNHNTVVLMEKKKYPEILC